MRSSLAPVLLAALVTGCSSSSKVPNEASGATAEGPCSPDFKAFLSKQSDLDNETLARLTLTGIAESCSGLSGGVKEGIQAISLASPADGATLMMATLEENSSFARLGCPDFKAASKAMVAAPPAERVRTFYKGCELGRLNLVAEAELDTAWKTDSFATGVIAAPSLYVWLVENRMTKAEARKLARLLMGLR